MNPFRQLFGQTAVYGLGTVVPRLLNYLLLTPFFTRVFGLGEYGVITELYAYVVFLMIILTYGMETAFFRFAQKKGKINEVFSTSLFSLIFTSGIFITGVSLFSDDIAAMMGYASNPEYIVWIGMIVGIDAVTAIPFARLRWENKAVRFAMIKILSVVLNIALNFILLWVIPESGMTVPDWIERNYDSSIGLGYVFISNLAASCFTLILLTGVFARIKMLIRFGLLKQMLAYSYPLLISGLAGTVNEALDRVLLKHLLTDQETAMAQLGIYGANYKIAVLMTLFIQMFRYAGEPFYFDRAERKDAKELFAGVMKYFVIAALCIFLAVTLYIEGFKHFIGKSFHEGLHIVPVVLFANLLLGVFFNLSIWYKLNNLTRYGALITIFGAGITFVVNWFFIPHYGYMASAWAHVACYGTMVILSYVIGRKYYTVPYPVGRILLYTLVALGLFGIAQACHSPAMPVELMKNSLLFAVFLIIVVVLERKEWKSIKE